MPLTRIQMEAKLAALEDRLEVFIETVDRLEKRLDRRMAQWADWALVLHVLSEVVDRQLREMRGKSSGPPSS